jgi:hypothetical protein
MERLQKQQPNDKIDKMIEEQENQKKLSEKTNDKGFIKDLKVTEKKLDLLADLFLANLKENSNRLESRYLAMEMEYRHKFKDLRDEHNAQLTRNKIESERQLTSKLDAYKFLLNKEKKELEAKAIENQAWYDTKLVQGEVAMEKRMKKIEKELDEERKEFNLRLNDATQKISQYEERMIEEKRILKSKKKKFERRLNEEREEHLQAVKKDRESFYQKLEKEREEFFYRLCQQMHESADREEKQRNTCIAKFNNLMEKEFERHRIERLDFSNTLLNEKENSIATLKSFEEEIRKEIEKSSKI